MKLNIVIFIALTINTAQADCIVQEVREDSAKLFCINTNKTEFLESASGNLFKVLNYDSLPSLEIYTQNQNLAIGQTLKNTTSNNKTPTQMAPIEIPVDTTNINSGKKTDFLQQFNPFKSESLKVYATALQLEGSAIKAEFADSSAAIDSSTGEFNSLPLDLSIELDFGTSGLILSPDLQDKTGEIAGYAKLGTVDIGGYFSINNITNDIQVYDGSTIYADAETNSRNYGVGLFLRNRAIFDSGELHTIASFGYVYSGTDDQNKKSGTTSNIIFNAAQLTVDLSYYKKISKEFYIGSGLYLGGGIGHIEYNGGTSVLADQVKLASLQVNFLKVMMVY